MNHPNDAAPRNSGWQTIRDAISTEIQNGVLKPGAKLPTEPELCSLFGATRYAVRRAVEALAVDGKLRVEQGRGTFVESASKLNYRVGRRARFRQNLLSEGVEPDGEILSDEIVPASPAIAQALELTEGAPVHRVLQRSLADGVPISLGHTYVSALRFPEWPRYVRQGMSMSDAYRALLQRLAAVRGRLSLCADQAAAAKWWLSMPMASVSAEGPMPKALSTRRTSPLMPGCRHQGRACPLRRARMTSNPLIVA